MKQAFASTPVRAAVLLLALGMGGCSSVEKAMSGDKIDYGAGAQKTAALEVPPDLTPLVRDGRYLPQAGSVSANALAQQKGTQAAAVVSEGVAPQQVGGFHLERDGSTHWLVAPQSADALYPQIRQFWLARGFTLTKDDPQAGVMETDWAENRAKLPQDIIRATLGKLVDSLYSTGERDKFRTRLERTAHGTEIYVTHQGLEEVYTTKNHDDGSTTWTNRPSDPGLETEMLTRMMVALGAPAPTAGTSAQGATATTNPVVVAADKARKLSGQAGAALEVDDALEPAWRRVGLALDRSGFTVEDRDHAQMLYFVRYADPKSAGSEEPNFFSRLFGGKKDAAPVRFRIALKTSGDKTTVSVLNDVGAPDNSANAQRIVGLLVDELKF